MNAKACEFIIDWSDDDQCHVVKVPDLPDLPDLPGCMAHGKTRQQAFEMAVAAIELWLETAKEDGVLVPKPSSFAALA